MTQDTKRNEMIILKNGYITYPKMFQDNVDTGWNNRGAKLSFKADYDIADNTEAVKVIAEEYEKTTKRSLNADFKECLNIVKDDYKNNRLYITKQVSDKYNLGVDGTEQFKYDKYSNDGNIKGIIEMIFNSRLEKVQQDKKLPFFFKVEFEHADEYFVLPKLSVVGFGVRLRQNAIGKGMKFMDGTPQRFTVKKYHENNNLVKRNENGNQIFPRENNGFVEYGNNYKIFPEVRNGAIFETIVSLSTSRGKITMYPIHVSMLSNPEIIKDDVDISTLGFTAPAEAQDFDDEIDFTDDCPF